jgi:hypothetical protein
MRKAYSNLKAKVVSPKTKKGMTRMIKATKGIEYYDLVKNWRKIKPHLGDPELNDILVRDFNKLTEGRWGEKFRHGQFPREFENTDWDDLILDDIDTVDWDEADYDKFFRDFREPEYWRYVKHGASHWLVNFTLRLAQLVEPKKPWRILASDEHAPEQHFTVWDGDKLLFDFNFQAFGIPAADAFEIARAGRELKVGERLEMYIPEHWTVEARRHDRGQRRRFRSAGLARDRAKAKGAPKRSSTGRKQQRSTR